MLDNNTYNLLLQLTEENKCLWRIKNNYLADSTPCDECKEFWQKLEKEKEGCIKKLTELVKKQLG